jgi:hypothetical protein
MIRFEVEILTTKMTNVYFLEKKERNKEKQITPATNHSTATNTCSPKYTGTSQMSAYLPQPFYLNNN